MHEKRSKIDFFVNFRKLQKKLHICKKKYAEILRTGNAVVKNVEKKVKSITWEKNSSQFGVTDCNVSTIAVGFAIRKTLKNF